MTPVLPITTPVPKLNNPRLIFDRLFGSGSDTDRARRERNRRSILDHVREDAAGLQPNLSANDQRRLDEYLTSIRDVEERLRRFQPISQTNGPGIERPAGTPADYAEHARLMFRLQALAFQADLTRISTMMIVGIHRLEALTWIGPHWRPFVVSSTVESVIASR